MRRLPVPPAVLVADIVGNAEQVTQDAGGDVYHQPPALHHLLPGRLAALRSIVWFAGLALIVAFFVVSV
jgi:uncharacterized MAPEG superfamily protein